MSLIGIPDAIETQFLAGLSCLSGTLDESIGGRNSTWPYLLVFQPIRQLNSDFEETLFLLRTRPGGPMGVSLGGPTLVQYRLVH